MNVLETSFHSSRNSYFFFFFLKRIDITRYMGIIILMGIDILRNGKQPNKKIIIL